MSDAATILRDYLNAVRQIKRTNQAVAETSYYGAMEALFNAVGASLKPAVFCVVNLRNRGSGIPDGGLFTENQQNIGVDSTGFAQLPARGAIEAKPTSRNIDELARSDQVNKYHCPICDDIHPLWCGLCIRAGTQHGQVLLQ